MYKSTLFVLMMPLTTHLLSPAPIGSKLIANWSVADLAFIAPSFY